jgi:hypothetical protein
MVCMVVVLSRFIWFLFSILYGLYGFEFLEHVCSN